MRDGIADLVPLGPLRRFQHLTKADCWIVHRRPHFPDNDNLDGDKSNNDCPNDQDTKQCRV